MATVSTLDRHQPTHRAECPCCSAPLLDDDGKATASCPHFLYCWNGGVSDFDECTAEVEAILDRLPARIVEPTDQELLAALPREAVVYEFQTREFACGPVVRTDVLAIDPTAV